MPEEFHGIANVHLDAVEHGADVVFLHIVKEGPANQSYGVQVAKLAGVPEALLALARTRLARLESQHQRYDTRQGDLFAPAPDPVAGVDPKNLGKKTRCENVCGRSMPTS